MATLVPGSATNFVYFSYIDKILHGSLYCILMFLIIVGFTKQYTIQYVRFNPKRVAFAVVNGYGLLLEIIQIFIPGRTFDFEDLIANASGTVAGFLLFLIIYKL